LSQPWPEADDLEERLEEALELAALENEPDFSGQLVHLVDRGQGDEEMTMQETV
jgi:hypothetical protein